jgi:hypothetical protein
LGWIVAASIPITVNLAYGKKVEITARTKPPNSSQPVIESLAAKPFAAARPSDAI